MKSKILALFLALVMVLASVPYSFAAGSYNRSKAVAYAKEHWKDDKGQCAEFVSDCLKAGGSNAWNRAVKTLLDKLNGQGTLYSVADGTTSYKSWKLNKSACNFDVKPGDLVFFYCKTCAAAGKSGYCHVAIIIGFDSKGNIVCAQHNGAIGYYDTIRGFGHYNTNVDKKKHEGSAISLKIFHMKDDGASISSLVKALPAPPSKVVSKWTLSVSDNTGTSATLKADVTCTPANVYKIGLEIGTSSSNMKSVASRKVGSSLTSYSVKCDGSAGPKLTAGKTYYYRFYVQRIDGKNEYSSTSSFTAKAGGGSTPPVTPPAPVNAVSKWTLSVSGITTNSATVRADITCTPSKLSKVGLELGTSAGNMKSVASWKVGSVLTYCTVKCDGSEGPKLSPGTTYYYRFYVLRTDGKYEYSSTGNFTTKSNACTNHTYGGGTVTVKPTCTAAGTIVYKCTKCGASKTEAVKAKGHTAVALPGKAATCTATGLTEGAKCSVCNVMLTAQTEIPKLPHSYTAQTKPASCTENGYIRYTCSCGASYDEPISAKGHQAGSWTTVRQPQPGVPGLEEIRCTVCRALIGTRETAPLSSFLPGDVDRDGKLTAADARLVLRIAVGLERADSETFRIADFNGDGKVAADDARSVLRRAVGLS